MNHIFNYESDFFSFMNKIVDAFYASVLWVLFSLLPVLFHIPAVEDSGCLRCTSPFHFVSFF